jgi:hypothetical protein
MKKTLAIIVAVFLILGGGGYILASKADAATPVDPLFKVDLFFENLERMVTFNEVAKTQLEQRILEERQTEVETVLGLEDISQEKVDEALNMMNQQRERVMVKLGEVQENQEQKGNTQAVQSLEKVQNQYQESLQKQYETVTKAQEQYGVGEAVKQNIDNALKNQGIDMQNQQVNMENEGNSGNTPAVNRGNN